ncbi:hypothetical protein, partial [Mesorhizobium sp.]|uniref:hypothetical protein n=1 Tax=Mesorhizobium sp. TaxID=1871066 RepID=UPI0025D3549D
DFSSNTAGQRYNVGVRNGLVDKDWIAHGDLLIDLGRGQPVTSGQRMSRGVESLIASQQSY